VIMPITTQMASPAISSVKSISFFIIIPSYKLAFVNFSYITILPYTHPQFHYNPIKHFFRATGIENLFHNSDAVIFPQQCPEKIVRTRIVSLTNVW
jgi:hypothetical protein